MERIEHQAQQIGDATDTGASVPKQREQAREAARTPEKNDVTSVLLHQNGQTLNLLAALLQKQSEKETELLGALKESLHKQNEFYTELKSEITKSKNGDKSMFRTNGWERAHDGAWSAGKLGVGVAIGYGVVQIGIVVTKKIWGA